MRFFTLPAIALLVLPPAIAAAAAPSWAPATATSVSYAISSNSTFVIHADVTLPQSCDAARIRTLAITDQLHRSFIVEMMAPSSTCVGKTLYKCTVVSPTFNLPIQHPFKVESKGKTWEAQLATEPSNPTLPTCAKG